MKNLLFVIASIFLVSCATTGHRYTPVVDLQTAGKSHDQFYQDLQICREYAMQVDAGSQTVRQGVVGGAGGAGAGAIIGALFGTGVSRSAGQGAAIGGGLGLVRGYTEATTTQKRIIQRCMQGRGYTDLAY